VYLSIANGLVSSRLGGSGGNGGGGGGVAWGDFLRFSFPDSNHAFRMTGRFSFFAIVRQLA